MENVYYPFRSVGQLIAYYLLNNPARSKSINILEPEGGNKPRSFVHVQDEHGRISTFEDQHAFWCLLAGVIDKALKAQSYECARVFKDLRMDLDRTKTPSVKEYSKWTGRSPRYIHACIKRTNIELERLARVEELLPPADKYDTDN